MFKDLNWLIKLQKIDSEIYMETSEQRRSKDFQKKVKIDIEEHTLLKYKIKKDIERLLQDRENVHDDINDQKRILEQKKSDLQNEKKTKKEHIKRDILKLDQAVDVFTNRSEKIDSEIKQIQDEVAKYDKKIEELEKILKSEEKKLKKLDNKSKDSIEELLSNRDKICKNIRKPFLNHYDRILNIRHGIAITYVTEKGLCQGCKIHVPYQYQQKIKQMSDYNICEGCGRILVDEDAF